MGVQSLDWEEALKQKTAACSSILACEIPWTKKSGGLQSVGSPRIGHKWTTEHTTQWKKIRVTLAGFVCIDSLNAI